MTGFLVASVLTAIPAGAQLRGKGMPRPILIRVDGFIGDRPTDPLPYTSWTLSVDDTVYPFQVLNLVVLVGDTSKDNIIDAMEPYVSTVTYFVYGPVNLRARVAEMPRSQVFSMFGYIRFGQRVFNITEVGPVPDSTPAGATPSPAAAAATPTP